MHRPHEITKDVFDDARFGFGQVNVGDTVDAMWGYSELALSFDDIVHLLRGGCLYSENGEYAQVIVLRDEPWMHNADDQLIAVCKQLRTKEYDEWLYNDRPCPDFARED